MIKEIEIYNNLKSDIVKLEQDIISLQVSSKDDMGRFYQDVDSKLKEFNPTMMVYGVYNAGKSTIINALYGKEVAKVSDIPETSKITPYTYHNYTIYDTPGINAPIEHEKITKEQYTKCDVVLFVMSNGGSVETQIIYDEIERIINDKKPVIIVLNKKQKVSKEDLSAQKEAIYRHLDSRNLKCQLIVIDAKSAFKGKVEDKQALLEDSNFKTLEYAIDEIMQESGKKAVINTTNKMFESAVSKMFDSIDSKIQSPHIKMVEEEISKYEMMKRNCEAELLRIAAQKQNGLTENLYSTLKTGDTFQANQVLEDYKNRIENAINNRLQDDAKELGKSLEKLKLDVQQIEIDTNDTTSTMDKIDSKLATTIGAGLMALPIPIPQTKVIGGLLLAIAPFIDDIKDFFLGSKAERENQREIERIRAIQDGISEAKNSLQEKIESFISQGVDSLYNPLIEGLKETLDKHIGDEDTLRNLKEKLSEILDRLPVLSAD